jgi:hypothetical protein
MPTARTSLSNLNDMTTTKTFKPGDRVRPIASDNIGLVTSVVPGELNNDPDIVYVEYKNDITGAITRGRYHANLLDFADGSAPASESRPVGGPLPSPDSSSGPAPEPGPRRDRPKAKSSDILPA